MINIGKYNELEVAREVDFGIYVTDGETEILMPKKYVPKGTKVGDKLQCLVYHDSGARLLATTEKPLALAGQIASMECMQVTKIGAFVDWGASKELLVPLSQQNREMEVGRHYIIYVYVDEMTGRLAGSARVDKYLDNIPATYEPNEEVEILVWKPTPLGFKVIINNQHSGLIYQNQIFKPVYVGDRMRAWVKGVRDDEKIDLMLQPMGYRQVIDSAEQQVLRALHLHNGFLPLTDKSDPAEVAQKLEMSKKNFKKAVGALYKEQRITIEENGIRLRN